MTGLHEKGILPLDQTLPVLLLLREHDDAGTGRDQVGAAADVSELGDDVGELQFYGLHLRVGLVETLDGGIMREMPCPYTSEILILWVHCSMHLAVCCVQGEQISADAVRKS